MLSTQSPHLLIGLDVETSDWDDQITFAKQEYHFRSGFPCHVDHMVSKGYVCGLGYCVFLRDSQGSNTYLVEEPVSIPIKLPNGESIAAKAFAYHGLSDAVCSNGQDFSSALKPIIALLRQGAQICCHNLAHATLVFCREVQKRTLMGSPTLSEDDAQLLLHCLYLGHCTSILASETDGHYCRLIDEYQRCFGELIAADVAHVPGLDAYKCGRLFLLYNKASLVPISDAQTATRHTKKAKVAVSPEVDP